MSFFKSSSRGPVSMSYSDYMGIMKIKNEFTIYRGVCGSLAANTFCLGMYNYLGAFKNVNGFYDISNSALNRRPFQNNESILFASMEDKNAFINIITLSMESDLVKINERINYVRSLYQRALDGSLRNILDGNTMNWDEFIPHGFDVIQNASNRLDKNYLYTIWNLLTRGGENIPVFRPPNLAGAAYPSSVGGTSLLRMIFEYWEYAPFPPKRDTRWENWALFFYGASMAVQAHVDANKRVSRAAYVLIITNSECTEKRAPNNLLTGQLARM